MCGIAGVIGSHPDPEGAVASMVGVLAHRGPDDSGQFLWEAAGEDAPRVVALGHTRLAILDLSQNGHQPMADDRFHLSFNGEIYNFVELRSDLQRLGHSFVSASDTEVLLKAWAEWGESCLERLDGMFAFAVLDRVENKVYLARDPFGIKPLFVTTGEGFTAFASELLPLLDSGLVDRRADVSALYDYLRWGLVDHNDQSLIAGVRRLAPGHVETYAVDGTRLHARRYFSLPAEPRAVSFAAAAADLRELFLESIALQVRSDVPVGSALSGGIDSSSILCAMRHVLGTRADLHAFSYVAEDPRFDEERWIRMAAGAANATVHRVRLEARVVPDELDATISSQGEPFASSSIIAQRMVFRAARDANVTVLLDGQGADELFAGYRSYLAARFVELVRKGHIAKALRLARGVATRPDVHLSPRVAAQVLYAAAPERLKVTTGLARRSAMPAWLDAGWFQERGLDARDGRPKLQALQNTLTDAFDRTSLPSLLRYEDRNSMAFSRESRVPFLAPSLVGYVFSLPNEHLVAPDGTTKLVFREAMRGIVPDAILDRRDKIGFQTPEDVWLRANSAWVDQVFHSEAANRLGALDVAACRSEWERARYKGAIDTKVWRFINAIRWWDMLGLRD